MSTVSKTTLSILLICILELKLAKSVLQCCDTNEIISNNKKTCSNGKNVTVVCNRYTMIISREWGPYNDYLIATDNEGTYLDAFSAGYFIREPNFCEGITNVYTRPKKNISAALICTSLRSWYHEILVNTTGKPDNIETSLLVKIFSILMNVANAFSVVLLFLCAFLYGVLPKLRDIQGKCYFHFTLNAALGHAVLSYFMLTNTANILPDYCITNLYVLMFLFLSFFNWSSILSFNTWRQTKNTQIIDESELMDRYVYFGYGVPAALLLLGFIHVHLSGVSEMLFVLDCFVHQQTIVTLYVTLPIFISLPVNLILFIDCQRILWSAYALPKATVDKRTLKILKYRSIMNAKLFFMMGIPWLFGIIIYTTFNYTLNSVLFVLMMLTELIITGEGICIFLIIVAFRKRVLPVIANEWFANSNIFPGKWKTTKDSELEQETENEENLENDFKVHYNVADKNEVVNNDSIVDTDKPIVANLIEEV